VGLAQVGDDIATALLAMALIFSMQDCYPGVRTNGISAKINGGNKQQEDSWKPHSDARVVGFGVR